MNAAQFRDLLMDKLDTRRALLDGMIDASHALRELGLYKPTRAVDKLVRPRVICFDGTEADRRAILAGAREFLRLIRKRVK